MPGRTVGSLQLVVDPELGLMAIGNITETDNFNAPIIPCYKDGVWSILRGFRGNVTDATRYGDTLVVSGALYAVVEEDGDSVLVVSVAAYYDEGWHPYGDFGAIDLVRRVKVLDGELYAIGVFLQADGELCNSIAKRMGGQWVPVGGLQVLWPNNAPVLYDAIIYQNDLYICGNLNLAPNDERGIIRYDGQAWSAPGGGIFGGAATGLAMAVYQDELYVGGSFYQTGGNPGHMIQRWNGNEWRAVGDHLTNANNDFTTSARVDGFFTYQDKLLVAGGFKHAGGVPAQTFAIWDGIRWCGTGDSISNLSHSIALYNDTIYLANGRVVNGDSTNCVVKWVSGALEGSVCSEPMSVQNHHSLGAAAFVVHPSAHGQWTLLGLPSGIQRLDLFDSKGALVHQASIAIDPQGRGLLQMPELSPGLYTCRAAGQRPARLAVE